MKLELKHIVRYLPYKLKIVCNTIEEQKTEEIYISIAKGIHSEGIDDVLGGNWNFTVKPILRPLSDLTKEIEVNGKKLVPIDVINKHSEYNLIISGDYTVIDFENLFWKDLCVLNMLNIFEINELFEKLYEWHFDIHGLIEKGLAIDINTLNK